MGSCKGLDKWGTDRNRKGIPSFCSGPKAVFVWWLVRKEKQSTKQSWFSLAHLACCASASAKSILQSPWSRGSPIAGAAKGLEPCSSSSRQPTAPAPLHPWHVPTHSHLHGHCCSACRAVCSCCPLSLRPWGVPPAWAFLWGPAISNPKVGKSRQEESPAPWQ